LAQHICLLFKAPITLFFSDLIIGHITYHKFVDTWNINRINSPPTHQTRFCLFSSPMGQRNRCGANRIPDYSRRQRPGHEVPANLGDELPDGAQSILVILLDNLFFGASIAFGGPCEAPNFDKLATNGMRVTVSYCVPMHNEVKFGNNRVKMRFTNQGNTGFPGENRHHIFYSLFFCPSHHINRGFESVQVH
jgi:hypothetical protein